MGRSFLEAGLEKPLKPGRKESVLTVPACQEDWPGRGKTLLCQPKTLETAPNGGCIDFPPPGSRLRRNLLEGTGQIGEKHWGLGRVGGVSLPIEAAVSTWSVPKGQVPKEGSRPGGAHGRGGDARIGREAGRATSRATSRLRQSFRWRGPLSAAQSGPAPSLVGDQWAGHPSGPGTTEGQTAPPYCPGGDKGAKKRERGREGGGRAWSGDIHKLAWSRLSFPFKHHTAQFST